MEENTIPKHESPGEVARVLSFIRVGATLEIARTAAGWSKEEAAAFKKESGELIEQATAQFKVLCYNSLMVEGGASGAKFLLSLHQAPAGWLPTNPNEQGGPALLEAPEESAGGF